MKTIRALFSDHQTASRSLEALKEAGFDKESAFGLGYTGPETEEIPDSRNEMVVVKVEESQLDTAQTILKNGGAVEVETMTADWEPDSDWEVAVFGRASNA